MNRLFRQKFEETWGHPIESGDLKAELQAKAGEA